MRVGFFAAAKGLYEIMRYTITKILQRRVGVVRKRKESVESVECGGSSGRGCVGCKQANACGSKVFCGWLKKFVDESRVDDGVELVVCPRFEVEPLEYKVYRRA